MQYRYGAGGVGSFLAEFAFDAALFLAFGGPASAAAASGSTSSCFGGSGSTALNFQFLSEFSMYKELVMFIYQ